MPGARKPSPAPRPTPRPGSGAPASGLPVDRRVPTGSFGNKREIHVCRRAKGGGSLTPSKGRGSMGEHTTAAASFHCCVRGRATLGMRAALGPSRKVSVSTGSTGGHLESWVFIWIYSNWQNSVSLEAKVERGPCLGAAGVTVDAVCDRSASTAAVAPGGRRVSSAQLLLRLPGPARAALRGGTQASVRCRGLIRGYSWGATDAS